MSEHWPMSSFTPKPVSFSSDKPFIVLSRFLIGSLNMVSKNLVIKDMGEHDEYYVGTCTHVNESTETDLCSKIRNEWFRDMHKRGLRIKVALLEGKHVGFAYMLPIEISPWGPLGEDLLFIPCLVSDAKNQGVGKALIDSAEKLAREQSKKGVSTIAYFPDFFFMPGEFFERCGFEILKRRTLDDGGLTEALMLKAFEDITADIDFLERGYGYEHATDKTVVDLFWNPFCQTSVIEANRVKRISEEYGNKVLLNEYKIDDRDDLLEHGIYRGIFVNGKEIYWGYEAPEEGIREAIDKEIVKGEQD